MTLESVLARLSGMFLMQLMSPLHRSLAPAAAPFFCLGRRILALISVLLLSGAALAGERLERLALAGGYPAAREALIESIESEGLVVGTILPFSGMLERTGKALGKHDSPLLEGEVIQFCSATLAWTMVEEDPAQLALCPLSIALYRSRQEADRTLLSARLFESANGARGMANDLLQRIMARAVLLSAGR